MMKDLKLGFAFMRYAPKKGIGSLAILFILLGFLNMDSVKHMLYIIGGYFLTLGPYMLVGMFQTVNMSNLVLSSPKKRKMEVQVYTLINVVSVLIGFVLFSIILLIELWLNRCSPYYIGFVYTALAITYIIHLISAALSYKHSILSSVITVIGLAAIIITCIQIPDHIQRSIHASLGISFAIVGIVIGSFAFLGITKLIYKTPMSKYTVKSMLQEMK